MRKANLIRITALFFAFMLCFTLLSRAAWQEGTAVVKVSKPESRMITHQISAVGKVEQNQEYAVVTEPDQRVTGIYVQEGQKVKQGDLLFEIDTKLLEQKILYQKQEMEKFRLQMEDTKSQKEVNRQKGQNERSSAAENYSLSTSRANTQMERARRNLQDAKEKLKEYYKTNPSVSTDTTVMDRLEKDCEEKRSASIQAEQELTTLQWKIELAVEEALEERNPSSDPFVPVPSEPSQDAIDDLMAEESENLDDLIAEESENLDDLIAEESENLDDLIAEESENLDDFMAEESEVWIETWPESTGAGDGEAAEPENIGADEATFLWAEETWPGAQEGSDDGMFVPETEIPEDTQNSEDSTLSQEEADQIEREVRESFQNQLEMTRKKVEAARAESESAQAALDQYQQEQLAAADAQTTGDLKQLAANVRTAQDAYEDAAIAANEAAVTGGRAVRSAGITEASDSTEKIQEITYEQMQLELDKLEGLKQDQGKICAPVDGLVTKIGITTGEKTSDTTAFLLADLSKGYHFTTEITKEQEKYLGTGDLVSITSGNRKILLEELPVTSVMADEQDENTCHVTVLLPEDSLEIGMSATLDFTRKSRFYPVCIPISALHLDQKNQTYVLVPVEYQSIMGTETRTGKINVSVIEQNESFAALKESTLPAGQEILIQSDKQVEEGSRVRIEK